MKKIAVFTTAYFPFIGGAEVAVKEISKRLTDHHFDVYTARLSRKLPKTEVEGNVTIHRLGWGCFLDKLYLAFWGHRKVVGEYDLIWGIMASFGGLAAY